MSTFQSADVWAPGTKIIYLVNGNSTVIWQRLTAGIAQTRFNITNFQFVPNVGSLFVYINGVLQQSGIDYTEDPSGTSIVFLEAPVVTDVIDVAGFLGIASNSGQMTAAQIASALGGAPAITTGNNAFTGTNTFVTQPGGTNNTTAATTAFVAAAVVAGVAGVATFNTRTGAVVLNSADVTTALGFTPGVALYENIKAYGAVGDNVTDDTTAFTSAIAASVISGKLVWVPAGTYKISQHILVPTGCKGIIGAGNIKSIIIPLIAGLVANDGIFIMAAGISGFIMRDLQLNYSGATFITNLVSALKFSGNALYLELTNLHLECQGLSAVTIDTAAYVSIDGCFFGSALSSNNLTYGIKGNTIRNAIITNCNFSQTSNGCLLDGPTSTDIAVTNCLFDSLPSGYGIYVGAGTGVRVANNTFTGVALYAIQFVSHTEGVIQGNVLTWTATAIGGSKPGITLDSCSSISVDGNVIANSYGAGILCTGNSSNNLIANNILKNCAVRGTAAAAGTIYIASLCSVALGAALVNTQNYWSNNTINNPVGVSTYGYAEFVSGGGLVNYTYVIQNIATPGSVTNKFLLVDETTSLVESSVLFTYLPVLTSSVGAIVSYTVNSATYKRKGREVEVIVDISIIDNGTGATALFVTLPLNAATAQGVANGRNFTTGASINGLVGTVAANIVALHNYDNTYPGGAGQRFVVQVCYYMA